MTIQATQTPQHRRDFKSLADFFLSVRRAAERDSHPDPRLTPILAAAPTTYSQESTGADGGYLVPPDIRAFVTDAVLSETSLLGLTDRVTTQSNSVTIPGDAAPAWINAQPTLEPEGNVLAQTKVKLEARTVRLSKVQALLPVSSELFEDAVGLEAYLRQAIPARLDFAITNHLINGDGVGKPLGIMNSPALITQAAEGGQGAGTLQYQNLTKMWSRMWAPSRQRAVWLMHSSVEQALLNSAVAPPPPGVIFYPAGGPPTIFGRPVLVSEACQAVGTPGDVLLVDPKAILTATREGVVREDMSLHVWFDLDLAAFRFVVRIGAMPWWASTVTQKNGGVAVSTAVALAAR